MERGTIVDGRFRVEGRHAVGGMAEIYRAVDLETSARVAIKVLRSQGDDDVEARFVREASLLADLDHPGIVRYIAHGRSSDGDPYLAMEWIEGEPLSQRLRRGPLSVEETVILGIHVADALAAAHARNIVHRDLKPGNLVCEAGDVARVRVLDFGLARNAAEWLVLTRTGEVAGTPRYMAPEQARGLHDVDARADVYSLGCVLFECLTGHRAFAGEYIDAVLAKILVEEAPRVSEVRPDVPFVLDDLIARMLAKNPADRPGDGAEVVAELQMASAGGEVAPAAVIGRGLGRAEQRVMCVILAASDGQRAAADSAPTRSVADPAAGARLAAAIRAHRGNLEQLAGGSLIVTFGGPGSATDLATRAARCALEMAAALADKQVALVTGRGVAHERIPVGAAIDHAARLVAEPREPGPSPVRIDDVTAHLLDRRFEIVDAGAHHRVLGFTDDGAAAARMLLGKPTPFVGRDRELGNLLGTFDECRREPLAQVVVLIGAAGAGKSRLQQELVRRVSQDGGPVQVWIGRGDPMSAGAPLSLLAQMIRREAGIAHGEPMRVSRGKLHDRVLRQVRFDDVDRVTVFLGEMCGVPFHDQRRPMLRVARRDVDIMGDQMQRAWCTFVASECEAGPLVLVLEDLHWGDLPTVSFVDAAARTSAHRPLLVLALARPEVHHLFPDLWSNRIVQVVTLRPLGRAAARALVEHSLGTARAGPIVESIVDQAGGNPFYLEELIRAAAMGEVHPGTVLAMIGGRLELLPGEQRRLLRAASVLGESFWPDALAALVGPDADAIDRGLHELVDKEWLVRRAVSARAGQDEYAFRHALVREAADAMLTDEDRRLGHQLAGDWLERSGETDAMTIGEHFERGGRPGRAIGWYARAARQSLEGTDLRAAVDRARRGLACAGVTSDSAHEDLGQLRAILAEAYTWLGDNVEAEADGVAALEMLPPHSAPWYAAASQLALAAGRLNHHERVVALAEALRAAEVAPAEAAAWMRAALATAHMLAFAGGHLDLVDDLLARTEPHLAAVADADPSLPGHAAVVRAARAGAVGDFAASVDSMSAAAALLARVGHRRRAAVARHDVGSDCMQLGAWERAEQELRAALAEAEQLGMTRLASVARMNLGLTLAMRGAASDGERLERESLAALAVHADARLEAGLREYLARILLIAGDAAGAEAEVQRALPLVGDATMQRLHLLGLEAAVLLQERRAADARQVAGEGMNLIERLGEVEGDALVRLCWAEALHATGDAAAAREAIARACDRLHQLAARIHDDRLRASFLTGIPENARTLELARRWSGPDAAG